MFSWFPGTTIAWPAADHAHRQAQHAGRVRTAVDEVADEERGAAVGMHGVDRAAGVVAGDRVSELAEQRLELRAAAVDVTDRVERARHMTQVVVQALTHDDGRLDLLRRVQDVHGSEALALQTAKPSPQVGTLATQHVRAERPIGSRLVPLRTELLRQVEHDRDG